MQVAGYTVPEDALSIGQNSQWAQASITAASQGCPLSLSEEEGGGAPTSARLGAILHTHVSIRKVPVAAERWVGKKRVAEGVFC